MGNVRSGEKRIFLEDEGFLVSFVKNGEVRRELVFGGKGYGFVFL